jgi:hypothetical protein
MSYSKRILFGDDPADDPIRAQLQAQTEKFLEPFKFKVPTRRRNRSGGGPYWDAAWHSCVIAAATELNVRTVNINSQVCMRSQAEADAVRSRAEEIHAKKLDERVLRLRTSPIR